jgi:hypothetical protein
MDMWERSWQDRIQTGITEALSYRLDRRTVDVIHAVAPRIAGDVASRVT